MLYRGFFLLFRAKFVDGDKIALIDEERNAFDTVVIDKKIYKRLKKECEDQNKDYRTNMMSMYNEYLRNIYMK